MSKHQNEDSTKRFVGISVNLQPCPDFRQRAEAGESVRELTHPVSKKMLRNSSRTFISGCSAPPNVGAPSASKLYFLNEAFSHAPLRRRSWEMSALLTWRAQRRVADVRVEQLDRQIRLELGDGRRELGTLLNLVVERLPARASERAISSATAREPCPPPKEHGERLCACDVLLLDQLALPELGEELLVRLRAGTLDCEQVLLCHVLDLVHL